MSIGENPAFPFCSCPVYFPGETSATDKKFAVIPPPQRDRNARILTIEDEPTVRSGIVAYLEDSGYEMLQAHDGLSGIDLFRREHPDAVLCDLRLPGADGLEVLSTITRESPETPVIIVSGANLLGDAIQALKRGAWDYITKPIIEMGVLDTTLCRALERAELMQQNRYYREHLEKLNRELSLAVERLQEDEKAGRHLQDQLMPPPRRRLGDYIFHSRLYPSTFLSGDFVDYFPIDNRYLGFYMADVSGHGAASAFITVMLTTLMGQYRQASRDEEDPTILQPERTLMRLNRDLCRQRLDKYLTIFYGVIDQRTHCLICSNGGQFPYPMIHDNTGVRSLAYPSRPVGLFEDSEFPRQELELPDEFSLWLISDGLLEIMPERSIKEKFATLQERVADPAINIDNLAASMGLPSKTLLPDDITFFQVQREKND
ncbi:phosphoserine phosphatase RsbU/P [Gammaproteobacteria bacterium]